MNFSPVSIRANLSCEAFFRRITVCRKDQHEQSSQSSHSKFSEVEEDERMMRSMHELMPDLHLTIEDKVTEGDKMVCRNR
jgi:predicted ester cyclase